MNWDAVGAIGEVVGAAAVIFSLLYLAIQLRQANNVAKAEYHTNMVALLSPFQNSKLENVAVFKKGLLDFRALTTEERFVLDGILVTLVMAFKDVLEAHERGFMGGDDYAAWEGYIGAHLSMPGATQWWEQAGLLYIPKVQEAVNVAIAKTPSFRDAMPIIFENET